MNFSLYLVLVLLMLSYPQSNYGMENNDKKKIAIFFELPSCFIANQEKLQEKNFGPTLTSYMDKDSRKNTEFFLSNLDLKDNLPKNNTLTKLVNNEPKSKLYMDGTQVPPFIAVYLKSKTKNDLQWCIDQGASALDTKYFSNILTSSAYSAFNYFWSEEVKTSKERIEDIISYFFDPEKTYAIVDRKTKMLALIAHLKKQGIYTGLFGNANKYFWKFFAEKYRTDVEQFDTTYISGEMGKFSVECGALQDSLDILNKQQKSKLTLKEMIIVTTEAEHQKIYIKAGINEDNCILIDPHASGQAELVLKKLKENSLFQKSKIDLKNNTLEEIKEDDKNKEKNE